MSQGGHQGETQGSTQWHQGGTQGGTQQHLSQGGNQGGIQGKSQGGSVVEGGSHSSEVYFVNMLQGTKGNYQGYVRNGMRNGEGRL